MTVSTATPVNVGIANGVTTVFPYQFKIAASGDLYVGVNGSRATLDVDYTLDGVGEEAGGNVTFTTAPANGARVSRIRLMEFKRETDFQTGGDLRAAEVNNDFDAAIMMIQQLAAGTLQKGEDPDTGEFVWDAEGHRIINVGDAINTGDAINLGQMYIAIEEVLAGGGIGVTPRYWQFTGNGTQTDFPIEGADVSDALFYDTVLAGAGQEPYDQFTIILGEDTADSVIRFATAPPAGADGFTILRGYARPSSSEDPITSLRIPIKTIATTEETIDNEYEFALIRCTAALPVTLTLRANSGAQNDMDDGSFFSVVQKGDGQVEVLGDGFDLDIPAGFVAKTRAKDAVMSLTCEDEDNNVWLVSGDMAEAP